MSDEDESSGWQLTESDPGVFTELLKSLGVDLVVDDLYSLDPAALAAHQPIRALIFLFKWESANSDVRGAGSGAFDPAFPGFFAQQVVQNACATLAVLNALLNVPALTLGGELADLKSFTVGMDPQTCGMAITSSDFLRQAHNALSPPSAISLDGVVPKSASGDAYHFVVYAPVAGCVYELDGLKEHPVKHGGYNESGEGWVAKAREVIEARIATYPAGSIEFNLMAIHDDPLPRLQSELASAQSAGQDLQANELVNQIAHENEKRDKWAFESSLRRHNYVGLIHAMTLALAKAGLLEGAVARARTKMQERVAAAAQRKGMGMDED